MRSMKPLDALKFHVNENKDATTAWSPISKYPGKNTTKASIKLKSRYVRPPTIHV